ncbi:PREDICTED: transmembrane 4 L6 family member 4-like [Nanorana parkeri]|uniref:transmembrane 4 L6 family member 4-like n=1 Tax=Nanorana parkeri TaxID=125878 RepID=UPI000854AB8E|nr:PREDICTED: transmembrane 4 L6 family member 4-like [Nanorana parkeri]
MCTGKCAKFIGIALYPLVLISLIANIIQFFPGWEIDPISNPSNQMTPEVLYLGGVIGGGLLVLIPAIHIQATGRQEGCCNNRCGMFLSIIFAAIGVAGSVYGFAVSVVGMVKGPTCLYQNSTTTVTWGRPFYTELDKFSNESYLFNHDLWSICKFPADVTLFNVVLFSIVLSTTGISLVLCVIQMLNGLFGCCCGTCRDKK